MADRRQRLAQERGMVTAELAIGVMVCVSLVVAGVWAVMLVVSQTRCGDVAAEMARQLARGDQQAAERARGGAPAGSRVAIDHVGGRVVVSVSADSSLGRLGPVHLKASAAADVEPGVSR